jgi:hypothetical protein
MRINKFTWENGWLWDCSKVQRMGRYIEIHIAVDIWKAYRDLK